MATTGKLKAIPAENASRFDHDLEKATPYYYSVLLEDYHIDVEYTATEHSSIYRFTFPESSNSNLMVNLLKDSEFKILNEKVIEGFQTYPKGALPDRKFYFHAEFSKPLGIYGGFGGNKITSGEKVKSGSNIGFYTSFPTNEFNLSSLNIASEYLE